MTDEQRVGSDAGVDTTVPSIARVYDAFLGGKDNFEVDRAARRMVLDVLPEAQRMALMNRAWLVSVVSFLAARAGIDQFLDLGSGLPTKENTHQVAQRVNPAASVAYVDNDPACRAFGHALLEENTHTRFVSADLTRPRELLTHPDIVRLLDFQRPMALIQCSTVHHVPDRLDPSAIMAEYIDGMPSGSYLALTHFYDPEDVGGHYSTLARRLARISSDNGFEAGFWRPRRQIESYFAGLEMVAPGLAPLPHWWADEREPLTDPDQLILGGVGYKP